MLLAHVRVFDGNISISVIYNLLIFYLFKKYFYYFEYMNFIEKLSTNKYDAFNLSDNDIESYIM